MLEIEKKLLFFNTKEVYFSDEPKDVDGCQDVEFKFCKINVNKEGFEKELDLTLKIDLTKTNEELWRDLHRNCRNQIKRAKKLGVIIRESDNFDDFYKLYSNLFKKKGLMPVLGVFGFGIVPLEVMKKYGRLFIAELDGEMLCGDVYLENGKEVCAWVGASRRLDVDREKAKLLAWAAKYCIWEVLIYYKNKNHTEFDFGGMWPEEEAERNIRKKGINSFKKCFGGEIVSCYSYRKFYSNFYKLTRLIYDIRNYTKKHS